MSSWKWIMKAWTEAALYGGHHAKCANLWPAEAATQQHKFWMATVQGMMLGNLIYINIHILYIMHYIWSSVHVEHLITFECLWHEDHTFHLHRKDTITTPQLTFVFLFLYLVVNRQPTHLRDISNVSPFPRRAHVKQLISGAKWISSVTVLLG